jgi:hypothetical protein
MQRQSLATGFELRASPETHGDSSENISSGSDTFSLRRDWPIFLQFARPIEARRRQSQRPEEPTECDGDSAVDDAIAELMAAQLVGDAISKCVAVRGA